MISTFLPLSGWFQQVFEYPETVFTDTMDRWEGKPQKHGANMSPDEFYKHVLFFLCRYVHRYGVFLLGYDFPNNLGISPGFICFWGIPYT
jgi:hypothetical protein